MDGAIYLNGSKVDRGVIDRLSFIGGEDLVDLTIRHGDVTRRGDHWIGRFEPAQSPDGLHARRIDGNAIKEVTFQMDGERSHARSGEDSGQYSGRVTVIVSDDFALIHQAIDAMVHETFVGASDVFEKKPFRRAVVMESLFEHLKMPRLSWCCIDNDGMPGAVADATGSQTDLSLSTVGDNVDTLPALKPFRRYCAKCHQGEDTFPPNFLHGSPQEVLAQVNHCAERIFFRLEMWRLRAPERPETPMPPGNALHRLGITPDEWGSHADLALLKKYATDIWRSGAKPPQVEELVTKGYDNLRECLPTSQDRMVSDVSTRIAGPKPVQ
jgi:hypothetical protein